MLSDSRSAISDSDSDGYADQSDPANGNACVPDATACVAVPAGRPVGQIVIVLALIATGIGLYRNRNQVSA